MRSILDVECVVFVVISISPTDIDSQEINGDCYFKGFGLSRLSFDFKRVGIYNGAHLLKMGATQLNSRLNLWDILNFYFNVFII